MCTIINNRPAKIQLLSKVLFDSKLSTTLILFPDWKISVKVKVSVIVKEIHQNRIYPKERRIHFILFIAK